MKTNIFFIPAANTENLKSKLVLAGLEVIHSEQQNGWTGNFYFSQGEEPNPIPWVETFSDYFQDGDFKNLIYFGAYIFEKDDKCFVLSFGKSHFYIRPFCQNDFGVEIAKRIANQLDIKQTSSKKFAGKKKKEIKSYTRNTKLDIESGESVDFLQAAVEGEENQKKFGKNGKFGSSLLINPQITKLQIGQLFDDLISALNEDEKFKLPRTVQITNDEEVAEYDTKLLATLRASENSVDVSSSSHELVGVDFVFAGNEKYTLKCWGYESEECGDLDIATLLSYIDSKNIPDEYVFNIKIKVENEGQKPYQKSLRESLDFIVDDENVMLSQGAWVRFNEDYIEQLNEYIDGIEIEVTEDDFKEILSTETVFNASEAIRNAGYQVADKDFSKIDIGISTPIEAWDLQKGSIVYAVKFGTAQKLGYVCDQVINVAEIIRSKSNLKKLDQGVKVYCLWLGFELVNPPTKISDTGSLILKQKIEAWARKCSEVGLEPKIKISKKV